MPRAIIVGAGVFGASVAYHLTRSGWRVTLIDRYAPGHVRAASGDESRLLRFAHGSERWYVRSVRRARELWLQLEQETAEELFVPCGLAWLARREHGWEGDSARALEAEGIPFERLAPASAVTLFPSFDATGLDHVLFEPEAGILRARRAVQALVRQTVREGTELVFGEAQPAGADVLVDGNRRSADAVVWACGPWLPGLFPGLVSLRVTKQDVFYFGSDVDWQTPPVPGWVDYEGATYGIGDLDGRGVKVAPDREGPEFDPDRGERIASPETEQAARGYLAERFPKLAGAPLVGTRTCAYSLTEDTHFLVAPHPDHDRTWFLGGGSGHGFKHGPALGEYVGSLLSGASPDPRFGLQERDAATKLRTAGAS